MTSSGSTTGSAIPWKPAWSSSCSVDTVADTMTGLGISGLRRSCALTIGGVRISCITASWGLVIAGAAVTSMSWLATSFRDSPIGDAPVGGADGNAGADGDDGADGAVTGCPSEVRAAGRASSWCWSLLVRLCVLSETRGFQAYGD